MKIFDAEPGMPYNKTTHQNVVKMLAQAYVFGEKAREAGVDQSWEYRAMVRAARMEFIMNRYNRKLMAEQTEPPQISENLKKFEYYYNAKKTYKGMSYKEALPKVTRSLESRARISQGLLSRMEAWNKAKVFFYDRSKASLAPVTTAEGFLAKADSLSKEQKFEEAIKAYHKVVELFSDRDSLFRTAVFSLAQAYADAQKFEEAAGCYDVFLKVWPDSPETEKALFSFGFILNENLHQDSLALVALEDPEALDLVQSQLEWTLGRNPFSSSLMYGVGDNFAPLFVYTTRHLAGAIPAGIDCLHDDQPFWDGSAHATSHEIWIEPESRFLGTLSVYLKAQGL